MSAVALLIGGYFVAINAASVTLFWYDKHQAQNRGWRIPEKQLQLSALLGGWVGGFWAMKTFKHKTIKQEFRIPYFIATGLNIAALGFCAVKFKEVQKYLVNSSILKSYLKGNVTPPSKYSRRGR